MPGIVAAIIAVIVGVAVGVGGSVALVSTQGTSPTNVEPQNVVVYGAN
ncbi:MAG TPA: hypothetical protein VFN19_10560 [Candidatus Nanopelagicales bacterium]|jgi:hypothetical protein|nr:hypothetical protein [Candidatus Nanopelagicales bacterium]